jgi:hypothetical protein
VLPPSNSCHAQTGSGTAANNTNTQGTAAAGAGAGAAGSKVPAWVRCTMCHRTVLPIQLTAHLANCAGRRAQAERQAAALAAKASSLGRPATPPLSTTSGRSLAGTAAAAAAGAGAGRAAGSGGAVKSKRSASHLNPNRSRSPATAALNAAAAGAGAAAAAAAAAGAGALQAPGVSGLLVTHQGAVVQEQDAAAAAAAMAANARRAAGLPPTGPGAPGALGPGLMVYGGPRGPAAAATAAGLAAGADAGKPPLPKPGVRSAAAAAAAAAAAVGGELGNSMQQQQQAGVAALIHPGGVGAGVLQGACAQNPGASFPQGFAATGEHTSASPGLSGGLGQGSSPSTSLSLPAPALNPRLLAQLGGAVGCMGFDAADPATAAAAAGDGAYGASSSGQLGAGAVSQGGGAVLLPDHPAAVPHLRRPRSAQPPRWVCPSFVLRVGLKGFCCQQPRPQPHRHVDPACDNHLLPVVLRSQQLAECVLNCTAAANADGATAAATAVHGCCRHCCLSLMPCSCCAPGASEPCWTSSLPTGTSW